MQSYWKLQPQPKRSYKPILGVSQGIHILILHLEVPLRGLDLE